MLVRKAYLVIASLIPRVDYFPADDTALGIPGRPASPHSLHALSRSTNVKLNEGLVGDVMAAAGCH